MATQAKVGEGLPPCLHQELGLSLGLGSVAGSGAGFVERVTGRFREAGSISFASFKMTRASLGKSI